MGEDKGRSLFVKNLENVIEGEYLKFIGEREKGEKLQEFIEPEAKKLSENIIKKIQDSIRKK